jgi:hypothetical protein
MAADDGWLYDASQFEKAFPVNNMRDSSISLRRIRLRDFEDLREEDRRGRTPRRERALMALLLMDAGL